MRALRVRIALVTALPFALPAAPSALAGPLGHSPLVPLPSVSPPVPLGRAMAWAAGARSGRARGFEDGRAVIGVRGAVDGPRLARALGVKVVESLPGLRLVEVSGPPARLAALSRERDARIRYVEPLVAGETAHLRDDPLTYEVDPSTGVPYEWQFHAIGGDQALNLAKGDPSLLVGSSTAGSHRSPP